MSDLMEYAKEEIERAWPDVEDENGALKDPMQSLVKRNVMELMGVFCEQGHSGMSASYILRLFNRLAHWLPIGPLTGDEDEWNKAWGDDSTQQNKRCGHVFRTNFDNSTAFDSEGKVFVDQNGVSYQCAESRVPITFPYEVPDEPEYVKADEEEVKEN